MCNVFIYYVYINTHIYSIYFENIYMYIYIYIHAYIYIYIIYKHNTIFLNIYMHVFIYIYIYTRDAPIGIVAADTSTNFLSWRSADTDADSDA